MNKNTEQISVEISKSKNHFRFPKSKTRPFNIAVVGATGMVGQELLAILHQRRFPIASIKALASENSAGEKIDFGDDEIVVSELKPDSFAGVEVAFFAVDSDLAKTYCEIAAKSGTICIDKSSAYRKNTEIPLVVPEVNPEDIANYKKHNIISSPNCTATPLIQVLAPLHKNAGLKRVVMSSYQAVSGAGQSGMEELNKQTRDLFNMRDIESTVFQNRIAFNVLPCIPADADWLADGSTDEEAKVIEESRRILGLPHLKMAVTCVRVPVFSGHSESVNIEFERAISPEEAREILVQAPGVVVIDDPKTKLYPTPVEASGEDLTLVGRIRRDTSVAHGLSLWLTSDNLRTGAALNAVRIAEILCSEYLS